MTVDAYAPSDARREKTRAEVSAGLWALHPDRRSPPPATQINDLSETLIWWEIYCSTKDAQHAVVGDDTVQADRTMRKLLKGLAPQIPRWECVDADALTKREMVPYRIQIHRWLDKLADLELLEQRSHLLARSGEGRCILVRGPRRSSSVGWRSGRIRRGGHAQGRTEPPPGPLPPRRGAAGWDSPGDCPASSSDRLLSPLRESAVLPSAALRVGRACASRPPNVREGQTTPSPASVDALEVVIEGANLSAAIATARTAASDGGEVPALRALVAQLPSLEMSFAVVLVAWELLRRDAGLPPHTRLSDRRFRELLLHMQLYDRWVLGRYQGERSSGAAALALLDLLELCAENEWRPLPTNSKSTWLTVLAADPAARTPKRLAHYRKGFKRERDSQPWLHDLLVGQGPAPIMSLAHLSVRLGQIARQFRFEARIGTPPRAGQRRGTRRAQIARQRDAERHLFRGNGA